MLKYSCYIEYSEEAREWLEYLGIEKYVNPFGYDYPYLFFDAASGKYIIDQIIENDPTLHEYTSCLGNLPLFKALTAVRDDSDYMQQFTDGIDWYLCESNSITEDLAYDLMFNDYHKATKEELIERFKKEKQ